jgi:Domain of unknown function (DUF4129)
MLARMRGSRRALAVAAVALLLLVVLVTRGESAVPSQMHEPRIEQGLPFLSGGDRSGASYLQYSPNDVELAAKVVIGLAVVMLLLAVGLSVLSAIRNRIRNRGGVGDVDEPVEGTIDTVMRLRLREAVQQARDSLVREGGAPRDAVIRAWVTLENATEHKRAPHQTATEFTVSLLSQETADEAALHELRTLYQRARFGHLGDEHDAVAAGRALDRILATIR